MHLRDYLAQSSLHDGPSSWLDVDELDVPSGRLAVADPSLYPDGVVVSVVPGRYRIQVQVEWDSQHPCIARLRAFSAVPNSLGSIVDEVSVDFARLGVGDNEAIAPIAASMTPEMEEPICEALETDEPFGIVTWSDAPKVLMPFVTSGYGDGRYAVRQLLRDEVVVGIEVDFVAGLESDDAANQALNPPGNKPSS